MVRECSPRMPYFHARRPESGRTLRPFRADAAPCFRVIGACGAASPATREQLMDAALRAPPNEFKNEKILLV
jgi:hypothetical protein